AISATGSRDAASRARDRSSNPDSASHGGSTETADRAADRARRSRQDDDTVAATTGTAADTDNAADGAERDHHRGTAGRAVAFPAAAVAQPPQQRADSGEPEQ